MSRGTVDVSFAINTGGIVKTYSYRIEHRRTA